MAERATRRYRRVLLQIDAATHCRETMEAAIDIAARLDCELQGMFIEDSNLATVGTLDFIREFRLSSPIGHSLDRLTLEAQLRAMARSVQRQLERAGGRRKITVGFRAIRDDTQREEEELQDADLVIVESTGRLHSRIFQRHIASRHSMVGLLRPTLFLKGGKSLAPEVAIICDSLNTVKKGVGAAFNLLGAPPGNITFIPFNLGDKEQEELTQIAAQSTKDSSDPAAGGIHVALSVAADGRKFMESLSPADCVVVMMAGGPFLEEPANLEPLFTSRHPLLFVQ